MLQSLNRANAGIKVLLTVVWVLLNCATAAANFHVMDLRVQKMLNPVGIADKPKFSWRNESADGAKQVAYCILVSSELSELDKNRGDMWDSGKQTSSTQQYVAYEGSALNSSCKYFWKVLVWDSKKNQPVASSASYWVTGILDQADWVAKWITYDPKRISSQPLFRYRFHVSKPIERATVHISGLGFNELYLNGKKVGDHVLEPAQTNYDDYALYTTYDVTNLVKVNNRIGVMLGDGFFNQNKVWKESKLDYGLPVLLCQLVIDYLDRSREVITSDTDWEYANGPIKSSNIYAGETYDARAEILNWSTVNTDQGNWLPALSAKTFPPQLKVYNVSPIKRVKALPVKSLELNSKRKYIADFGQNFAGWVQLRIRAHNGDTIRMRFAEELTEKGELDMSSTGSFATNVEQQLIYVCNGKGVEQWEPRFAYYGFRYVEIQGINKQQAKKALLTGIVLRNSIRQAGAFVCSDKQLNRLHSLASCTLESNLLGVPTDCPTREKCGWLGDAHAMASMSILNYDLESFWIKYLYDIRSSSRDTLYNVFTNRNSKVTQRQGVKPAGVPRMIAPGKRAFGAASVDWGTAIVQIPWMLYVYYGNADILKQFYPDMVKWVEYCRQELVHNDIVYEGLGDWCPPNGKIDCPVELSSTAFHYKDLSVISSVAQLLNNNDDCDKYQLLSQQVKRAFIKKFYINNKDSFGSETGNALALDFDLVPLGNEKKVSDAIVALSSYEHKGFINVGIFGLGRIFNALSRYGNDTYTSHLLKKRGANSFEQMWAKYNATTLWEVLPVSDYYIKGGLWAPRQSHNHVMQASYDAYFYESILGINPDPRAPGYKHIVFAPQLTNHIRWAKGHYKSPYGLIKSEWKSSSESFKWNLTVPAGAYATIYLPSSSGSKVTINGKVLSKTRPVTNTTTFTSTKTIDVLSGNYKLVVFKEKQHNNY